MRLRPGFTLLEMMTSVAGLVIILGLMVSLARNVRNRSAELMTRRLLELLEDISDQSKNGPQAMTPVTVDGDEAQVQKSAMQNSSDFVSWLQAQSELDDPKFAELKAAIEHGTGIRDAWGTPIVYVPPRAVGLGTPQRDRGYFLSAGPDKMFTGRLDNIYSFDVVRK